MTPDESPATSPAQPRTTTARKLMKWFFWLALGLASLLLILGLLLTYWFPSNIVRQQLEIQLSELLQGTVTIQSLSFNALTGIQVGDLEFHKPNQPPLTFERLTLDYSLPGLLKGTFTINEIAIEQAQISLNLPELSQGPPSEEPFSPAEFLTNFPITIDLDTLVILDSKLHVIVTPDLQVTLLDINLQSSGMISSVETNLKGKLTIGQLSLNFQDKHAQLPLEISFNTQLDLPAKHLNLEELTLVSDSAWRMALSGTISDLFSQNQIHLSLANTQINLESIIKVAQRFVPPEWASATIQGSLSPTFSIKGTLPDSQFQGAIQVGLQGQDLQANLPSLAFTLGPTSLDIRVKDIHVKNNQPTEGTLSAKITSQNLAYESYEIENLDFSLASNGLASGLVSGNLGLSGTTTIPTGIVGIPVTLPFNLTLDANGNHQTRHVQVKDLNLDLNPYGTIQLRGALQPYPSPKEGMGASVEVRLSPKLNAILPLLPKDQLQGLVLQKGNKPDTLVLRATGALHPDFRPEWAKVAATLKLSSLQAKLDSLAAEGTMNQLTLLLSSAYQEKNGAFQGTLGVSSNLSNLHAADKVTVGNSRVNLQSFFQGNLSPTYQPTSLRSQDQLQLTLRNLKYQDPTLTATLPSLKLFSKTNEDVFNHDYQLENLRLTSKNILDMNVKGRFTQANQKFDVDLQVPLLHVGNLLPYLSGSLMKEVDEVNPKGQVSLALQAVGKVPQPADFKKLILPFRVNGKLTLHDLEGAAAGYQVQGGNGTMKVAYSPKTTSQTQFTTDLTLNKIRLPDTLPIKEVADTSLHVSMVSPDLNEVQIAPIHLTSKGIDLSIKGAVVGLRELLSSTTPRGTQMAKLFAQLETRLAVDVETFQEALQPLGLRGTGKALITMSMLKKEQGSLNTTMEVNAKTLSLTQDGTKLQDINGGIQFRKSLAWKPDGLKALPKMPFQPSNMIAQLKSFSRKGQPLTIKHLQIGPFTVQNFSTNLAFEQQSFKMQNLAMNLLGGGIGGNVIIAAEHPLRITAGLEVVNLDVNQLIKTESKIQGDSNIAATIALDTILQDATGAVDLSRLECSLHITHIGKEALDRLLVFLDPEGSNPTLSNVRAQLKFANPSQVTVEVARGQLSLTIHFQESLISTFTLDRIPIAKIKNIEKLTAAIPNWNDLAKILKLIGAETYALTPEGEIILE
ncbi:conserved hypothetical protein [Candidatus Nitrotoga sp. M5]|nr:conserved hypothetical protein [Candidatus Nitrotoga sp. M5]